MCTCYHNIKLINIEQRSLQLVAELPELAVAVALGSILLSCAHEARKTSLTSSEDRAC